MFTIYTTSASELNTYYLKVSTKIGFAYLVSVAYYLMIHRLLLLPAPTPYTYSLIFVIDQSTHESV